MLRVTISRGALLLSIDSRPISLRHSSLVVKMVTLVFKWESLGVVYICREYTDDYRLNFGKLHGILGKWKVEVLKLKIEKFEGLKITSIVKINEHDIWQIIFTNDENEILENCLP